MDRCLGEPREALAQLRDCGGSRLAGVDEAGRGPLAGPVVAAAVLLPTGIKLPGVTDSKQLTPDERERAFLRIVGAAQAVAVAFVEAEAIDALNILRATHRAMAIALSSLPDLPHLALVDGRPVPGLPCPHLALVKGDCLSLSIAAASIVAKVVRDRHMVALDALHPGYGFAQHKGYPTAQHVRALSRLGPSPVHRHSFAPVRDCGPIRDS